MSSIQFEWDAYNLTHLPKHGITTTEAEQVVLNWPIDLEAYLMDDEERLIQIGETDAGQVVYVISTLVGEKVRLITAWPAHKRARNKFAHQKRLGNVGKIETDEIRE